MASFQAAKSQEKAGASDAEAQAIAQIEKAGGSVRQIAQNDEHREVDFHLQGASCTDEQLAPLAKIKNVVSLNLGKTSVTELVSTGDRVSVSYHDMGGTMHATTVRDTTKPQTKD